MKKLIFFVLIQSMFLLLLPVMGTAQITADFSASPRSGARPLEVTFTDQSTGGPITSWTWYFEGGTPSYKMGQGDHTVTYNDTGRFNVTLMIAGGATGSETDSKTGYDFITVYAPPQHDFGDAPDDATHHYATLLANDGAYHVISDSIYLGLSVDAEDDGQPDITAKGDDSKGNDEDGVVFPPFMVIGDTAYIKVTAHGDGYLNAWFDFNRDGDWLDEDEQVFNGVPLSDGIHTLVMEVPHAVDPDTGYARFRFSTDEYLPCSGGAPDGEVEDYMVEFIPLSQAFESDSLALVALYNSTGGPNWDVNTNWLTGNLDTWDGVTLNSYTWGKRVGMVGWFDGNNLTGTLPPEIGNLTDLTHLDLFSDQISGSIPAEIGNCTNLRYLNLRTNQLSGSIPVELGNLLNLTDLHLPWNNLSGSIPVELGNLLNLEHLRLNGNQLSGSIPVELGNLLNLSGLNLGSNNLSGPIPVELGNLLNLRELLLYQNNLSGSIPVELGNLLNLRNLNLGPNNFTPGSIPVELGNLLNLSVLDLSGTQLTGTIPLEICNLPSLGHLLLGWNQLSGSIPAYIDNLNLTFLYLNENEFSGSIPTEIGNLTNLQYLYLQENEFSGSIPIEIGNLTQLREWRLSGNPLTGQIPTEIGNLINLQYFLIDSTQITDPLPVEIGNLFNLHYWNLKDNQFTELPDLSLLLNLDHLYIEENRFTFEDIEPYIGITDFFYSPQDSVGNELTLNLNTGATFNLSVAQVGGTANQYQWKRNGLTLSGATSSNYWVNSAAVTDAGNYTCEITNTIATALTLYSRPFHVIVDGQTGVEPSSQAAIPKIFALKQNYPNPFNPSTQIEYHLPEAGDVRISIYNIEGREVCRLVNAKKSAGIYTVHWNGNDRFGQPVASGIYFCRIDVITNSGQQPAFSQVKRMIFMK